MPHFKASGSTKYSLEALRLQLQLKVASPNLAHQIMWHRFVNNRGGMGNNIPCDLYNEHVNKLVKIIIQNMGSNLTEQSLQRAVRCVSPLNTLCKSFDAATAIPTTTTAHSTKSDELDIKKVVAVVMQQKLLEQQATSRSHNCFPKISSNPLEKLDSKKLKSWIKEKKTEYSKYNGTFRLTGSEDVRESDSDE